MFENLSEKLGKVLSNVRGYGKITEDNIKDSLREIRLCLLEADVNYKIVKEFTENVKEKALGEEVSKSLKPGDLFVKIVKDEIVNLLGETVSLNITKGIDITMLVGLQGSGKTTTAGKLGNFVRKHNHKKPMFIACDVYRPAAINQLKEIGKSLGIEVYSEEGKDVLSIAKNGVEYAKSNGFDYIIIDTAGRLQVDETLMNEIKDIETEIKPSEIILVIDAMMGQDAINVINGFNECVKLTGCILTKMDGNTKGGVALSLRHLTNVPIKLIGDSEKLDGISEFNSERMASRIIGEGDLLSIIEKTESVIDKDEAERTAKNFQKGKFDLEDFLSTMKQIKRMGPLENLLKLLPGASKMGLNNINVDPKLLARTEAIVLSMTPEERKNPDILKASRKIRIAKGCGKDVSDVNFVLRKYDQMKQTMKEMRSRFGGRFGQNMR